jgi:tetratricopeptide (TPR) repeat protein
VTTGKTFALIGALAAFPRRLAAREVERQGGELQHGITRRTSHIVFGRALLDKVGEAKLEARFDMADGAERVLFSENGFLRELGLLPPAPQTGGLARQAVIEQSKLPARAFDLLSLFDAFESNIEPYAFRDLILARKYAGLLAGGASWSAIARSVHRSGAVASLTALSLHHGGKDTIYARLGEHMVELDGQTLLPLERTEDGELEEVFRLAEEAEEEGRPIEAARLYQRYLAADPSDSMAAFNRANCLRASGETEEATRAFMQAIKLDPSFVEAWFNLADLMSAEGKPRSAKRHLSKAVALDPTYADAMFNLAKLEYEAGNLAEARRWWQAYLELDSTSEWARTAAKGIQYADLHLTKRTAS